LKNRQQGGSVVLKGLLFLWMLLFQGQAYAATAVTQPAATPTSIKWLNYSDAAFDAAKQEHKLVLMITKAKWCPFCQDMMKTLQDPGVVLMVMYNYIPVLVDVDGDAPIARQYKVLNLPTTMVLNSDKKILENFSGFFAPNVYITRLQVYTYKYHQYYQ
jgi:thiol:disulfide interchange protein